MFRPVFALPAFARKKCFYRREANTDEDFLKARNDLRIV